MILEMENKMLMKINCKKLIYFQIIYNCFVKYLVIDLGFPSLLNYVTDLITVALFIFTIKKIGL